MGDEQEGAEVNWVELVELVIFVVLVRPLERSGCRVQGTEKKQKCLECLNLKNRRQKVTVS
jgi:hypothetical protein